jgi:hypothetical protein
MSIELANEKWMDGHESGLLGQFASTRGYSDLIDAAKDSPALAKFFKAGYSEDVAEVQKDLKEISGHENADVASTAKALLDLTQGQEFLMVTNGGN